MIYTAKKKARKANENYVDYIVQPTCLNSAYTATVCSETEANPCINLTISVVSSR